MRFRPGGALAIIVAAAACYFLLQRLDSKFQSAFLDVSTLLGCVLAAAGAISRPKPGPAGVGRDYEEAVAEAEKLLSGIETQQMSRLLGRAEEPAQTRLKSATFLASYRSGSQPFQLDWGRAFDVFWGLRRRRMVILGEPGAGKTMLLLEIIRQAHLDRGHSRLPVLVRVNISEWVMEEPFRSFLVRKLSRERRQPEALMETMYDRGDLVPLLDGLDELDLEEGEPHRGLEFIRRLNDTASDSYPADWPLILTCRRAYFERLEQLQTRAGHVVGLAGSATYLVDALDKDQILSYLRSNLTDEGRRRWRPVLRALAAENDQLVRLLGSPWRLMLAYNAYVSRGSPTELLTGIGTNNDVEAGLLPQYLAVAMTGTAGAVQAAARSAESPWVRPFGYDQERAAHWLKQIALYLAKGREEGGGAGELPVYELHRMVNTVLMKACFACYTLLAASGAGALFMFTAIDGNHAFPRVAAMLCTAFFLGWGVLVALRQQTVPAGASLRRELSTPRGTLDLGIALVAALAASAFALGTQNTFGARVLGGLCGGFLAGLFFGFVHARRLRSRGTSMAGAAMPEDTLKGGLESSSVIGAVVAAIYGIVLLLIGAGYLKAVTFAACVLVPFAVTNGMPFVSMAWSRSRLASFILFLQRRLPWRATRFLRWSYDAGIMRAAGLAYQFRHLRLQSWLAETAEDHLLPQPVPLEPGEGRAMLADS